MLAQEADVIFGSAGHFMFYVVQAATALILFTGGNTSFSGFPFLASFVAEDSFLPRWLTKRGHRLVFSNGIIVLTIVSSILLIALRRQRQRPRPVLRDRRVHRLRHGRLRHGQVPQAGQGAGLAAAAGHQQVGRRLHRLVVVIFAVVKFSEGAWVIVILFPLLVFGLIQVNRQYRIEAEVPGEHRRAPGPGTEPPNYTRRVVMVFVDEFDLATIAALRYAKGLRPTALRAVHFVIDTDQAERLRDAWLPDRSISLDFVDCPDRRLTRAAAELVTQEAASRAPRSPRSCPGGASPRCSAGCCTTRPQTRSPAW